MPASPRAISATPPAFPAEIYLICNEAPLLAFVVDPTDVARWVHWHTPFYEEHGISDDLLREYGTAAAEVCRRDRRQLEDLVGDN